jgi:zinc-ribbon family
MLFIAGISSKQEKLNYDQTIVCSECGKYGHYEIYFECMVFSFFFIPIIRWNKKYYVRNTCCGTIYRISKERGEDIRKGKETSLSKMDLEIVHQTYSFYKQCSLCGYETIENFQYCPKCSNRL